MPGLLKCAGKQWCLINVFFKKKLDSPCPEENWALWPPFRFKTNGLLIPPAAGGLHQTSGQVYKKPGNGIYWTQWGAKSCSYWFTCSGQYPDTWNLRPPPRAWAHVCKEFSWTVSDKTQKGNCWAQEGLVVAHSAHLSGMLLRRGQGGKYL